jgi:hypothetical protein
MGDMLDLEKMKRDKLYDLICRATANGTAREVADQVAMDWYPRMRVSPDAKIEFIIGDGKKR